MVQVSNQQGDLRRVYWDMFNGAGVFDIRFAGMRGLWSLVILCGRKYQTAWPFHKGPILREVTCSGFHLAGDAVFLQRLFGYGGIHCAQSVGFLVDLKTHCIRPG